MEHASDPLDSQIGKRGHSRLRLDTPGRLTTLWGTQNVIIRDLSQAGARLDTAPSGQNADCVLEWLDYEAFGTVQWQNRKACGILFDGLIPPSWLIDTRDDTPQRSYPDREAARRWVEGLRM